MQLQKKLIKKIKDQNLAFKGQIKEEAKRVSLKIDKDLFKHLKLLNQIKFDNLRLNLIKIFKIFKIV